MLQIKNVKIDIWSKISMPQNRGEIQNGTIMKLTDSPVG